MEWVTGQDCIRLAAADIGIVPTGNELSTLARNAVCQFQIPPTIKRSAAWAQMKTFEKFRKLPTPSAIINE